MKIKKPKINEKWVYIKGYENKYQISNFGNIRKYTKNGFVEMQKQKKIKGYLGVVLTINKKAKNKRIHRLVAESFIPKIE